MNIKLIYFLLCSRYANSVIASSDENQFKYKLFSLIFQYGPTWQKELDIQKQVRNLTAEELQLGVTNILNSAANPAVEPSTQALEELPYIDRQNVSKTKRSIADGYALLLSLLKTDVTESFLQKFEKLFLTIVEPEKALWYVTYPTDATYTEEEEDIGNIYDGVGLTRNFRNRYFTQIFKTYEEFSEEWENTPFAEYFMEA